jgi:hypothetical protein
VFKFLAAVTSSLLISTTLATNTLVNDACQPFLSAYNAALSELNKTCTDLDRCQQYRTACPQQIDEYASCNVLSDCMAEQFPENASTTSRCIYGWSGEPHEAGVCENKNRSIHAVAKRCPGYSNILDRYKDQAFTCDGHKGRYWGQHSDYYRARQEYEDAMKDGLCNRVSLVSPSHCPAAFQSVSTTDSSHDGDSLEIISSARDESERISNTIEFHSNYENYRLPAGDSTAHGSGAR